MIEYMIRTCDGDWFNLHRKDYEAVLKPKSFASGPESGWGDHRIACEGIEISFSYEDPGIQVAFEGDIPEDVAKQIVEEIRERIEAATHQKGYVVDLRGHQIIQF